MGKTVAAFALIFDEETKPIVEKKNLIIDLDVLDNDGASSINNSAVTGTNVRNVFFGGDSTQWAQFNYDTAISNNFPYKWTDFTYDGETYDNTNSVLSKMKEALNLHQLDCYDDCSILEFHKHMAHITGLHDLCSVKCFLSLAEFKAQVEAMGFDSDNDDLIVMVGV